MKHSFRSISSNKNDIGGELQLIILSIKTVIVRGVCAFVCLLVLRTISVTFFLKCIIQELKKKIAKLIFLLSF